MSNKATQFASLIKSIQNTEKSVSQIKATIQSTGENVSGIEETAQKNEKSISDLKDRLGNLEECVKQLIKMTETNNAILKKLEQGNDDHIATTVSDPLMAPVPSACLISRPRTNELQGEPNTPPYRIKYFLKACLGDVANPDVNENTAEKEELVQLHYDTLERLGKIVLSDLMYHLAHKEAGVVFLRWVHIPLKYKLKAYKELRHFGTMHHLPVNRSRGYWVENDLLYYFFRNKKKTGNNPSKYSKSNKDQQSTENSHSASDDQDACEQSPSASDPVEIEPNAESCDADLASDLAEFASFLDSYQIGEKRLSDDSEEQKQSKHSRISSSS